MSYSQLVLSERPYGYWECSSLVDGKIEDMTPQDNHALISNVEINKKPIIYGADKSVKLTNESLITINNIYKIFYKGSEYKSATIELFFSIKDSSTSEHRILQIGSFLSCYIISDRIFIESGNKKASIRVDDWNSSQYLCIIYKNKSVSISLGKDYQNFINLGDEFSFPDTSPPQLVFGPSADPQLPMYINSIGLYTYQILPNQILGRLSWSDYNGKPELLAIANGSEVISPVQMDTMKNFSIDLSREEILSVGSINNLIINYGKLTMDSIPPVSVSSLLSSLNYSISDSGISFGEGTFSKTSGLYSKLDTSSSILRTQCKFDGLSTKQTISYIGPFIDGSFLHIYKSELNTVSVSLVSKFDTETNILESADIGLDYSEYFNIGVVLENNQVSLIVNGVSTTKYSITELSQNYSILIGNNPDGNSPFTSILKNFCIDDYNPEESVGYEENGRYMISFNNSFNVSQKGTWSYTLPINNKSILSSFYYNFASKNITLLINGVRVFKPGIIPEMIYNVDSEITIDIIMETKDSLNDVPFLSKLLISTYEDCYISSNNGGYSISPVPNSSTDQSSKVNAYEIKDRIISPICRPDNLGIKFKRSIPVVADIDDDLELESWTPTFNMETTGGFLSITNEGVGSGIRVLEFLIKIDELPSEGEEYCIFEVQSLPISLKYSNSGLVTSTGYSLYIDSVQESSGKIFDIDELYYVCVVFDQIVTSGIYLGVGSDGSDGASASMTGFAINNLEIDQLSTYLENRLNSILGRPYLSKKEDNEIRILDSSLSQQEYERSSDGKYFAMNQLPKIKIIQNKWELIK